MSSPSITLGEGGYQKKNRWGSNHGSQPSPILEDGEILHDTREFTTVVRGKGTAISRLGSTATVGSWRNSAGQQVGIGKTTPGAPYVPAGPRSRTILEGAIEKARKQPAHPTSTLGRLTLKVAPSHAATARSSHYHTYNNTSTVANRQERGRHITTQKNRTADKAEYKPGMIFYAMLHQEHWAGENAPTEEAVTRSNNGVIHSKKRPFVVLFLYDAHYVSLPLLTHSGRGIGDRMSDEYVSIYDPRSHDPMLQQSKHPVLWAKNMLPNTYPLKTTSTVHLTYPIARPYSTESWREGYLDDKSTAQLISVYRQVMTRFAAPSPTNLLAAATVKAQKERVEKTKRAAEAAQALVVTKDLPGLAPIERVIPLRNALTTRMEVSIAQDALAKALEDSLNLHI
ncbi:hypothetical protein MMC17_002621 [Xylographa soralifera]|nr:hypothetical protein [Xylographa soralifera]